LYESIDIAVNPVRCGSGLKIKNIEAMAHCVPLVTSGHGSRGIEDAASESFLVADTPQEYLSAFTGLIGDISTRTNLATSAEKFVSTYFSEKAYFAPLVALLTE
jgi:hypothetical protein